MANVNEFSETPRPTANIIRYIGGATIYDAKPLSEDLDEILNERALTVLFSMGSLAQSKNMPDRMKKDIIDTFASYPNVTFIWKYESDDIDVATYVNIHLMKWVPQTDLLADKRLSLFVTHGGMNSMLEAIFHGKPMVVVPLFGDQQLNSKIAKKRRVGILIERHNLNRKTLTEAFQNTLTNR
ncbi:unnamed protein product [Heligmosomoides polygyrus]|uniref:UDP-glucuronosyltransferase n=1 Tax=Heligmosomoides polygyrus TaxID=6339 RepID=A0A183GTX8_HELPZ|nr:unnamed protein product [Heligmosomoides polygyrus]